MAPAIGLAVNPPIEITANNSPVRMPISSIAEICATRAGHKEIYAPEVQPNVIANVINPALLAAGIHSARTRIPVK
jgi:hypothetical protein